GRDRLARLRVLPVGRFAGRGRHRQPLPAPARAAARISKNHRRAAGREDNVGLADDDPPGTGTVMANRQIDLLMHRLRRRMLHRDSTHTDGQLLDAFLGRRDDPAFEALVRRHGPMVLGVCRRLLGHAQDAEDAFQATFLVLVRKGGDVRPRDAVGNWLYGIAFRTAQRARAVAARRRCREKQVDAMPQPTAGADQAPSDWEPILDEELNRLPDKYRLPIVLCLLQGQGRREVSRLLKVNEGTLSSRLAAGRRTLARRLQRRGVALAGTALTAVLAQ